MVDRFRELAWDCQNCSTEVAGLTKLCPNCGAPQPENVQFHRPRGGSSILTDPKKIEAASKGPNIHCPYCETRNSADSTNCTQCGGDLTGGQVRQHGQPSLDAPSAAAFPGHGEHLEKEPPASFTAFPQGKPSRTFHFGRYLRPIGIWGGSVLIVALIAWFVWNTFFNVKVENVTIQSFAWQCTTTVEKFDWVQKNNQSSPPPAGARNVIQSQETIGYGKKDQCSASTTTIKTGNKIECGSDQGEWIDQGNGTEKWVPDMCDEEKEVPATACTQVDDLAKPTTAPRWSYEIQDWVFDYSTSNSGNDQNPVWPEVALKEGQRLGNPTQNFTVFYLDAKEKQHSEVHIAQRDLPWFQSLHAGQVCIAWRNGWGALNPGIDCTTR